MPTLPDERYVCPSCGKPKSRQARQCHACAVKDGVYPASRSMTAFDIRQVTCPSCGGPKHHAATVCMECRKDNADRPLPAGGTERARNGCIVSFEGDNGRRLTLHRDGPVRKAIRRACDDAVAIDPSFKVTAISTPDSIFTDLKGHRHPNQSQVQMPETAHLTGDLRAMLHPRLVRR